MNQNDSIWDKLQGFLHSTFKINLKESKAEQELLMNFEQMVKNKG
jgi:hypothetical protein